MIIAITRQNLEMQCVNMQEPTNDFYKRLIIVIVDPLAVIEEQIQQNMFFSEDQWVCSICGKSSRLKTDISRHIESIHVINHPGYTCSVCDYSSKSRNALRQHRSVHHPTFKLGQ